MGLNPALEVGREGGGEARIEKEKKSIKSLA